MGRMNKNVPDRRLPCCMVRFARHAGICVAMLLAGCVAGGEGVKPGASAHGATLALIHGGRNKVTLELRNAGSAPIAYDHWFTLGAEPVAYCRDVRGEVRFCSRRVMVAEDNQPRVHESYLQPGESVRLRALPSRGEQVGIRLWLQGKEDMLWLDEWIADSSAERAPGR